MVGIKKTIEDFKNKILQGDCIEVMKEMPDNSVDAIITDPPYFLINKSGRGFMGKTWDGVKKKENQNLSLISQFHKDWAKEGLRVLKSGGHILSFGGTRTYHRMACAIEDAGFECRDMIEWVYKEGFPKGMNVGKMYDKKLGVEREVVGRSNRAMAKEPKATTFAGQTKTFSETAEGREKSKGLTKGKSKWEGWGTLLKPAHEPICLARKPLAEKTIVDNILKYGTGGLNIDGCRIPFVSECDKILGQSSRPSLVDKGTNQCAMGVLDRSDRSDIIGRFPANVLCQDDALNDGRITKSSNNSERFKGLKPFDVKKGWNNNTLVVNHDCVGGDSGSNSRYFDIDIWAEKNGILQFSKASMGEKNKGCEGLELRQTGHGNLQNSKGMERFDTDKNNHPTVKAIQLMSYLITLVTRKNDIVLDPFAGSGTTLKAARLMCRHYIGIEKEQEYCEIARKRISEVPKRLDEFAKRKEK